MIGRAGSRPAGVPRFRAQTSGIAALPLVVGDLVLTTISDTLVAAGTVSTAPSGYKLVTSYTPPNDRNDYTGWVGMRITPASNLDVNQIGVRCAAGAGVRQISLMNVAGTTLRSVNIDLTGGTNGVFYYADVAPITLSSGTQYILAGPVTNLDGKFWGETGATTLAFGASADSVYGSPGSFIQAVPNAQFYGVDLGSAGPIDTTATLARLEINDPLLMAGLVMPSGIGLISPIDMISNTEHPPYVVDQSSTG